MNIFESFFDAYKGRGPVSSIAVDFEIFKNPSTKELREISANARGYLAPSGDLYVTSNAELIHADLLDILGQHIVPRSLRIPEGNFSEASILAKADLLGVCVVRAGSYNIFQLAESYVSEDVYEAQDALYRLFSQALAKNPSLEFSKLSKELI